MAGSEAIINKILEDAQIKAKEITDGAEKRAASVVSDAKALSEIEKQRAKDSLEKEIALVLERRETVATLDSRKIELAGKQGLIDKCFDEALKQIISLPDKKYLAFIEKLISENAEDGDEIVLSKDEKRIDGEFVSALSERIGKKISISSERGKFAGGIILKSQDSDKNLTVESLLKERRELEERRVAEILFG